MSIYGGIQLPKIDEQSMDSKKERKQILNYLALLDEKLRYMFQNIDIEENLSEDSRKYLFEQGEAILNVVKDTEGNFSAFRQEVDDILLQVENVDGRMSALQLTADGLVSRVSAAETGISEVAQTAAGIGTRVTSLEGSVSTVEQTAERIETSVYDLEGNVSTVTQTANSLKSTVSSLQDDVDDAYTMAEQAADHFSWIVESGTSASRMTLTDEFLEIVSDNITIKADIDLYGFMTVWRTDAMSSRGGYIGYSTGDDGVNASTSGCAVSSTDCDHYLLATNSGIRMTADTNAVVVMDSQISATEEISISSDERVKNSISYDMDKYDAFFEKLKPSFYRYNAGQSGRFHVGFIAQDVEQAIKEGGITTQDFAGLIQLKEKAEMLDGYEDQYYLRYENFIALNTHMIQKLMARVTELENKLEALS